MNRIDLVPHFIVGLWQLRYYYRGTTSGVLDSTCIACLKRPTIWWANCKLWPSTKCVLVVCNGIIEWPDMQQC